MKRSNIIPLIFMLVVLFYVILRLNIGGLFFAVLVLAMFSGFVGFYGKVNKAKDNYKGKYGKSEEKTYYDIKSKTMKKIESEDE